MGNLSAKTGFTPVQTRISLSNNAATSVANFSAYEAQELTGFVYIDATTDYRSSVKLQIVKNGAGTYEIAASDIAGDDNGGSPIVSFSISSGGVLSATLVSYAGFVAAYIQYNLNAPAIGQSISGLTSSSGSGSGEVNSFTNSSAATDTTGWTGVSRVTSSSPLDPIVTTAFSVSNTATAETSTSGGYGTIASLAIPLRSARQKIEFYYTTPATDVYRVSVYQGSTRLSLSTDSSSVTTLPANTTGGFFYAEFDTTTAAAYTVNITRTSGTTGPCLFTSVIFGPGKRVQGAAISDAVTYTPTTPNSSFSATTALTSSFTQWRRVGSSLHISGYFRPAVTQAVEARISLPTGLTIGSMAGGSGTTFPVGKWVRDNASATTLKQGVVLVTQGQQYLKFAHDDYTTASNPFVAILANQFANNTDIGFTGELIIPIAEWAGNGTVNLGSNAPVYYSGVGTWGTGGSPTLVIGMTGSLGGTTTPAGTNFTYTLTPAYPIQAGAVASVQTSNDGIHWSEPGNQWGASGIIERYRFDGTNYVGIGAYVNNSGNVLVSFGKYSNGTSGAWGGTWYWRVVVEIPGYAVGFGLAGTDGSSGLYKPGQAPGLTTGAAIAAGYIGQVLAATATVQLSTSIAQVTSISLTAGVWLVTGSMSVRSTPSRTGYVSGVISTTSAANGTEGVNQAYAAVNNNGSTSFGQATVPAQVISVPSTTTYYLNGVVGTNSSASGDVGQIIAVRIA